MPSSKSTAKKAGEARPGLYANINAKHERIAHGSGEQMRKSGEHGAPSSDAFEKSQETSRPHKSSHTGSAVGTRKAGSKKGKA